MLPLLHATWELAFALCSSDGNVASKFSLFTLLTSLKQMSPSLVEYLILLAPGTELLMVFGEWNVTSLPECHL